MMPIHCRCSILRNLLSVNLWLFRLSKFLQNTILNNVDVIIFKLTKESFIRKLANVLCSKLRK